MKNVPMTAWIIDDEEPCSTALQIKLKNIAPDVTITGIFSGAITLDKDIDLPDVVFLDIEMPNINGLQFARQLSGKTEIVFTTAHPQYAVPAYDIHPFHYLVKPITDEKLKKVVTDLEKKIADQRQDAGSIWQPLEGIIVIPTQEGIYFVQVENIIRVAARNNCSKFILKNGESILAAKTLKSVELLLSYYKFIFRTHKSHIVNLYFADRLDPKGESGLLILKNGDKIEVALERKKELLKLLVK